MHKAYTSASEKLVCMFALQDMLLNLQAILLVTGFIGALGQIIQIPDTPTKTIGGFSLANMIAVDEEERQDLPLGILGRTNGMLSRPYLNRV